MKIEREEITVVKEYFVTSTGEKFENSFLILSDRVERIENFFFLVRIATKVDIASLLIQQIISGKLLCLKIFSVGNYLSVVPPGDTIIEVFQLHRLGLGKVLSVRRNIHSVEPCFCCRLCVIKEQQNTIVRWTKAPSTQTNIIKLSLKF